MASKKKRRSGTGVAKRPAGADGQALAPKGAGARFPIVGIGASAGGLKALKELFGALPAEPGAAFVVIQHLDPTRESLTAEILARHSQMRVVEVHDEPRVACNRVYIIPPGKYLSIANGELHLSEPDRPRTSRMAVDYFLRSLAEDQRDNAAAVILSGSGTDGALGVKAVKEAGGLVIVQEPRTADHDGMPRRAIETGVVDLVVAPARIGDEIRAFAQFANALPIHDEAEVSADAEEDTGKESAHLRRLLQLLRTKGNRDFRPYKETTLLRRARRRAALHRFAGLDEYSTHLEQNPQEIEPLARDLLINVTRFFRDAEAWAELKAQVIAPIVARKETDEPIRVWVPGCATGEEAYSLALVLMEELRHAKKSCPLQIFSTDIATHAVDIARAGRYPQSIEADVPSELLQRYFVRAEGDEHYRAVKQLRESIVFSNQDLLSDPPFSRLDLICCRNLLIYLKPEVQQRAVALFHFALAENGFLFLGSAETVGMHDDTFETLSKRWRLYRRIGPTQYHRVDFPVASGAARREFEMLSQGNTQQIAHLAQRWLLDWLAPSAVLINRKCRILFISGEVDAYLSRGAGAPSDDLLENVRKGLSVKLRLAVQRAIEERRQISIVARVQRKGSYAPVSILVRPLPGGDEIDHLLVLFEEGRVHETAASASSRGAAPGAVEDRDVESQDSGVIQQLEGELATMRTDLRVTIEQLESSNEEYKAANEEVMSINEELRSTNEELETSKEELQSLNEELHTVNDQLATKVGELETKNADLENLQYATDIATICLDTDLRVRWFTPATTNVIRLQPLDKGRPISDFSHDFLRDDLVETAGEVLRNLVPAESETECGDGRTYMRRVTPYRTDDLRIGGVVVTFVDITQRKRHEHEIREAKELAEKIIDTVAEPMLVLDSYFRVERANGAFFEVFRTDRAATLGRSLFEIGSGIWNEPELRALLARVLPDGRKFSGFEVSRNFDRIGRRTLLLNAQQINHLDLILFVIDDITERKSVEETLRSGEQRLRRVIETEAIGVTFVDDNGAILDANDKFLTMTGFDRAEIGAGSLTWNRLTPPEYAAETAEQLKRLASTGRLGPYEKECFRKDGSRVWMMIAGATLGDGTAVEFCLDVTSRKRAENALVDGDRRKDEFLATLAHELRNPLAPLTTAVEVLRKSHEDEPTRERMYAMMDRQLSHLVRLVDDLLDLARVSRGVIELRAEPLEVAYVVRTALETSLPRIEAAGRRLTVEVPKTPLVVKADAVRLAQVIVNLLNNAANYTSRNGQIWLNVQRENDHAVISVKDDGVGIAPEMLSRVFEMFVQVDRSQAGGLGIGLTLSQSLVQLHGGTLEAYSDGLGRGSEFVVRLPLSRDAATHSDDANGLAVDLSTHKVLVVDDNRDAADSLGMMLGVLGADVKIAYDGLGALRISESFAPDLVLLDIGMPGMDGFEVARRFRKQSSGGDCTLVAVTGWGQDADRRRSASAGFNYHLTKPVAVEALLDVLGTRRPPLAIETLRVAEVRRTNGESDV